MPRKYVKRSVAKSKRYRRYKRKFNTIGKPSNPKTYQFQNKSKKIVHHFKETINYNDINGAGVAVANVASYDMSLSQRWATLKTLYRRYRINYIRMRFRLKNIELTDNAVAPTMWIRYNYDPNLTSSSIGENQMSRLSNVVVKQFNFGHPSGALLEYTIKPAILRAIQLYNSTSFVPSPQFRQWVDFQNNVGASVDVDHYGIQYYINNLPSGITIEHDIEMSYSCTDLI